jgi:hypothetical protein
MVCVGVVESEEVAWLRETVKRNEDRSGTAVVKRMNTDAVSLLLLCCSLIHRGALLIWNPAVHRFDFSP